MKNKFLGKSEIPKQIRVKTKTNKARNSSVNQSFNQQINTKNIISMPKYYGTTIYP